MSRKVLVAEDDIVSAKILVATLERGGFEAVHVEDGQAALEALARDGFDLLITDWMMPRMDGIQLLREMRTEIAAPPPAVMLTGLGSDDARSHALESGADDFIVKPINPDEVLGVLADLLDRTVGKAITRQERLDNASRMQASPEAEPDPPCVAIGLVAGTGGPAALGRVLADLDPTRAPAIFVVMHGQPWVLEALIGRLDGEVPLPIRLAEDGMPVQPGTVHVAPGDRHLVVAPDARSLRLSDAPPENLVRPSADVLFRSVAEAFGPYSVAAVLAGMGCDGRRGVVDVAARGGIVLAQDVQEVGASGMPLSALSSGVVRESVPLDDVAVAISGYVTRLSDRLRSFR